ncbi:MAG: hypothetical protein FWG97_04435 [Deltaproteobacteria bacterium]|nr:hypothetical protein [Deltaproteobacteria bacterium]
MGIALLCAYGLFIFRAAIKSGGADSAAAFFVNNRASGAWEVAASIIASCIGASATIGMIGLAFAVGTPAFWWLGAGAAGLVSLSLLLASKVRESGAYTMPQLAERLLGSMARPLISVIIVAAWMAILAAQFTALALVIRLLTGWPPTLCLALGFLFIVLHSLGGQAAVMRLDRAQFVFLAASLMLLLASLNAHNPSWPGHVVVEAVNVSFPPEKLLYFLVVVGANYLVCPMLFGRLFSARDGTSARRGGLLAAAGIAMCAVVIVAIGLACRGLLPADTAQDAVLTSVLSDVLPFWVMMPAALVLLSAIVSSADSCLVTAATILSHDLLKKSEPGAGRVCVLVLGLVGMALSLWGKGIIVYLLMAYTIYASGVVGPVFIGLLLDGRRRVDPRFACAAVAAGGTLGLAAALSGLPAFSYAGMAAAVLITLAGTIAPRMDKAANQSIK